MPSQDQGGPALSCFEFRPMWAFYPPVIADAAWLLLQRLVPCKGEAGMFHVRRPEQAHLYFKRHLALLDSVRAAGTAIRLAFAGSHSRGAIFRNGTHLVTPEMEARFDAIAQALPEFHFGRFDVRFESFEQMQQGRGFTIVEVHGAGAESTHIWDRSTGLLQAWRDLMRQYRWLFEIDAAHRARGHRPMRWAAFRAAWLREKLLTPFYPATD